MADDRGVLYVRASEDRFYDELKPTGDFAAFLRRRLIAFGQALKKFITFCLSQFGLILLVVTYALIGAYIFGQLGTTRTGCVTSIPNSRLARMK